MVRKLSQLYRFLRFSENQINIINNYCLKVNTVGKITTCVKTFNTWIDFIISWSPDQWFGLRVLSSDFRFPLNHCLNFRSVLVRSNYRSGTLTQLYSLSALSSAEIITIPGILTKVMSCDLQTKWDKIGFKYFSNFAHN